MKILVTGGAGYIGSVAVKQLVEAGDEVVVLDNLSQGHSTAVHAGADFVLGDLCDRELVDGVMREYNPQAIMHFASNTLVGESMHKPFHYLGDNVRNGLNLVQSAVENGVERMILSSTANLFSDAVAFPIKADAPISPGSPYGESKQFLERLLYWMEQLHGLRYTTLRYFNASGAHSPEMGEDHDPETHIIPLILQVALGKRNKFVIYGDDYDTPDGTCIRDFVHVDDLAQAHILALRVLDDGSRTYNLGNGRGFSVKEVVETARQVTGAEITAEIGPRRGGDPAILVADSKKIKEELGWEPQYTELEDIVASAWEWHRRHPHGYEETR